MKVIVDCGVIKNRAEQASLFLDRDIKTESSYILIEAKDRIEVKVNNRKSGIIARLDGKVEEEGAILVDGMRFLAVLKALPTNDEVEIEGNENEVIVRQGKTQFTLRAISPDFHPKFPEFKDLYRLPVEPTDFIAGIEKVLPTIATNNPRFEINNGLLDIEKDIKIVGTDGFRMGIYTITPIEGNENHEKSGEEESIPTGRFLIPRRSLMELRRIFTEDMGIFFNRELLVLESPNTLFFSFLFQGNYPDYKQVIPKVTNYQLKLPKREIIKRIKLLSVSNRDIETTFKKDRIEFQSADEISQTQTELEITTPMEEFQIAFDGKRILDFLNVIGEEEFQMELIAPNKPIVLQAGNFTTLTMPIIK